MGPIPRSCGLLLVLALGVAGSLGPAAAEVRRAPPSAARNRQTPPLAFAPPPHVEENRGQVPGAHPFLARAGGYETHLGATGARFIIFGPEGEGCAVDLRFVGASRVARARGEGLRRGRSHYFLGNDPARWVRDARHFSRVDVPDLYPGVDLSWRPTRRGMRYDFEIAPGADPDRIRLEFAGALGAGLDASGNLLLATAGGTLRHGRPVAWQEAGGARTPVPVRFVPRGGGFGFEAEGWDRSRALVIDPTVEYSSYFGTGDVSRARACAIDAAGDLYVAGETNVFAFPRQNSYQSSFQGDAMFVVKLGREDHEIEYSTLVGSAQQEVVYGLALNASGEAYVTGTSADIFNGFPVVNAFQWTNAGQIDGFVVRLSSAGSSLVYSTLLGGNQYDYPAAIALDSRGAAWITGSTSSTNFPLVDAFRSTGASGEAFLARISPAGSQLEKCTFLGGSAGDGGSGVAVGLDGTVWVAGSTTSNGLATSGAFQSTRAGKSDAFVAAVNPSASPMSLSLSYFGGAEEDYPGSLAVDAEGTVCLVGETYSTDLPTKLPLQAANGGASDAFLLAVNGHDFSKRYATYLGGTSNDAAFGVALDTSGAPLLTGRTTSTDFPLAASSQSTAGGLEDIFLTRVKPDGSSLLHSTYWGGTKEDIGRAVATDGALVFVAGTSRDGTFPLVDGVVGGFSGQIAVALLATRIEADPMKALTVTSVDAEGAHLAWTDPHAGAYDVEIQRTTLGGAYATIGTVDAGTTEFVDGSIAEDANYLYRVRGTAEGGGTTAYSRPAFVRPPVKSPAGLAATSPDNRRVDLTWSDASSVEVGYSVLRRTLPTGNFAVIATLPAGATSHADTTVAPETGYTYKVRCTASSGAVGEAAPINITTGPREPTGLVAVALDDVSTRLSWNDVSGSETSYEIERKSASSPGEFALLATRPAGTDSHDDETVSAGASWIYRVRCLNANGASGYSGEALVTSPPAMPSSVTAEALSPVSVRLTWVDESDGETGFLIERMAQGDEAFEEVGTVEGEATTFVDATAVQETTLLYRVRARGSSGSSRGAASPPVLTPAQLLLTSARRVPAGGARPARLNVAGTFDTGETEYDPEGAASLTIGGTTIDIPGLVSQRGGRSFRHEGEGLRLDVAPAPGGGTRVSFTFRLDGDAAEAQDPGGILSVEFASGEYRAMGEAVLEEGAYSLARGVGSLVHPVFRVTSFRAAVAEAGRHAVSLSASFQPPPEAPAEAPAVTVTVGTAPATAFLPTEFDGRNGKYRLRLKGAPSWSIQLDMVRGTIRVRGARLTLGEFPEGPHPVRIRIRVGAAEFIDTPVLVVASGRTSW